MRYIFKIFVCMLIFMLVACGSLQSTPTLSVEKTINSTISGVVLDESAHPIANAIVRIKATKKSILTDNDGKFTFSNLSPDQSVFLTAWSKGYYIGGSEQEYSPGVTDVNIVLRKHSDEDNPAYQWVSPFTHQSLDENCENCHSDSTYSDPSLPFPEWVSDAHSQSTQNIRFLTMYLGQDVHGNQSPQREYASNHDYGRLPLKPKPDQPYYGPGYKLDFPKTTGNCATCHAPTAAINSAYETDPTKVTGTDAEGITCDFCHKIWSVHLDPSTGLPWPNMTGVLSFEFRRPSEGHQFFAGPLDDVAPGEDVFVPIQQQSQFCAPCHSAKFWDTQIYNSFGEWVESPYNDAKNGKTCQDCHMPAGKNDHFTRLDKGGVIRDPQSISSHLMPGASNIDLLQNAVSMTTKFEIDDDELAIKVEIINDKTGHHIPTGSPLRQMILLVNAVDDNDHRLTLIEGETVPKWGGVGNPNMGYYSGLPGKGFAKILSERWTETTPSGAYWNPTRIISDNRIAALATDSSTYIFKMPENHKVYITVTLLFRRAFRNLMDQKDWNVPDIVMERQVLTNDN